jgi:hypothetical protein
MENAICACTKQQVCRTCNKHPAALYHQETSMTLANGIVVRLAFEAAGVEFFDESGIGPGVRLRPSNDAESKKE